METSKELKIVIIARNPLFAEMLKKTIVGGLEEQVTVQTINSVALFLNELGNNSRRPDAVVLDYEINKTEGEDRNCKVVIDHIKKASDETPIIVISDEKDMLDAAKTLQYGASEYVTKDKFAFSHITNAVKSCLNPSRS